MAKANKLLDDFCFSDIADSASGWDPEQSSIILRRCDKAIIIGTKPVITRSVIMNIRFAYMSLPLQLIFDTTHDFEGRTVSFDCTTSLT